MAEIVPRNDVVVQDFASSGESQEQVTQRNSHFSRQPRPVGIKTPLASGFDEGLFSMHKDFGAQISDNLRNLIQTNHGERLGFFDFGANLQPLLLGNNADFETKAMTRISAAISKYMPFITLREFASFPVPEDTSNSSIGIKITYAVAGIDDSTRVLELVLKVGM